mmetsp:Transcript_46294/g.145210  ORF Transcript_46294/g.145210 Transcript_46294/m.145210 type:complete len:134 (+) Transcript_46294:568-969(+)
MRRRALMDKYKNYIDGEGVITCKQFHSIMQEIDNEVPEAQIDRMFRKIAVESGPTNLIDAEVFCDVLQENKFDRPAEIGVKVVNPYVYTRKQPVEVVETEKVTAKKKGKGKTKVKEKTAEEQDEVHAGEETVT